jgi:hypothetical protein
MKTLKLAEISIRYFLSANCRLTFRLFEDCDNKEAAFSSYLVGLRPYGLVNLYRILEGRGVGLFEPLRQGHYVLTKSLSVQYNQRDAHFIKFIKN